MTSTGYSFQPVSRPDLPLLHDWLKTEAVRRWWGKPEDELATMESDLNDPRMTMNIVAFDGQPFAYTQDYNVHSWPEPYLTNLPATTRAIDTFIGVPAMLGVGHGTAYMRLLATRLVGDGAEMIVIDPDSDNHAARRAYAKAGFSGDREVETRDGPAVLMFFSGADVTGD